MTTDDMGRRFLIDVDAAGCTTIRERGKGKNTGGLPVFSTDTREEAESLIVRHCRLARDHSGLYFLNDPPHTVADLDRVSELFRATHAAKMAPTHGVRGSKSATQAEALARLASVIRGDPLGDVGNGGRRG